MAALLHTLLQPSTASKASRAMELQPEATRKKMKNAMRVVALAVPIFSTSLPASVFMYWTGERQLCLGWGSGSMRWQGG